MNLNGVYSVVASAVAGSSLGVIQIQNGQIVGNDTAGAEYSGTAARLEDGSVAMSITMETPPGVFHIWSGSATETFQSRQIDILPPKESFGDGVPYEIPGMEVTVIFRHIPDDFAIFAGREGRKHQINLLIAAEQAWASHRTA
jgi:hypothetical protein